MVNEVTFEEGKTLKLLRTGLKDKSKALNQIGALLTNRAQLAFEQQKRGSEAWAPRGVPSIAGILSDLDKGGTVKDRRFQDRPAGIDTSRLRNSISWDVPDKSSVEVGTNVEYARDIQDGGLQSIVVTEPMLEGLRDLLQDRPALGSSLSFLLNFEPGDAYEFETPPRPFVTIEEEDAEDIGKIVRSLVSTQGPAPSA